MKKSILIIVLAISFFLAPAFEAGLNAAFKHRPRPGRPFFREGRRIHQPHRMVVRRYKRRHREARFIRPRVNVHLDVTPPHRERTRHHFRPGRPGIRVRR